MTRYVALLRGINVGGHRKVRMADLRAMLDGLGYTGVATLLQSGNAVLTAPGTPPDAVGAAIGARIERDLGFPVNVLVRTAGDLRRVVDGLPFPVPDPAKCAVAFLPGPVDRDRWAAFDPAPYAPEEVAAGEREFYLSLPGGLGRAVLPRAMGPLLDGATVRNWSTTTRLLALAEG
ncbi:DUF1697 domain-containing protein [Nocardiopsis trehalosi]|uniref:DUF1697 domain-containing protein n=1 Tax=Nocardiopsis trehalosi TaxID=109329 RepID=UPI00082C2630|nr:DUF1697 domain-containing protein [Nocardiopsis trehalosi]